MHLDSPLDSLIRYFRVRSVASFIDSDVALCDIGCGENPTLLMLLRNRVVKAVGLDRSIDAQNTIGISKSRRQRNVRSLSAMRGCIDLRYADFSLVPLPIVDGEFDVITMLAVLEHLQNPLAIIKECYRGLKKGGKIIITTPAPLSKPILEFMAYLNIISRIEIFDHKHYFKKKEIRALLEGEKFSNIKIWHIALNTAAIGYKR